MNIFVNTPETLRFRGILLDFNVPCGTQYMH